MERPENLKVGDLFRVTEDDSPATKGDIVVLTYDDGTDYPRFAITGARVADLDEHEEVAWIHFAGLEPYTPPGAFDPETTREGDLFVVTVSPEDSESDHRFPVGTEVTLIEKAEEDGDSRFAGRDGEGDQSTQYMHWNELGLHSHASC